MNCASSRTVVAALRLTRAELPPGVLLAHDLAQHLCAVRALARASPAGEVKAKSPVMVGCSSARPVTRSPSTYLWQTPR